MKIFTLTCLFLASCCFGACKKTSEPDVGRETPLDSIFSKDQQNKLRGLALWSPQSEKDAKSLLKTGDEVIRTITLKRISRWEKGRATGLLRERFKIDLSAMVRKKALELLWAHTDLSERYTEIRMDVGLAALEDKDDSVFLLGVSLMEKLLVDEYRPELKVLIKKAPKKRRYKLLGILCRGNLERKDLLFLSKEGERQGKMPPSCVKKVLTHLKSKNRLGKAR